MNDPPTNKGILDRSTLLITLGKSIALKPTSRSDSTGIINLSGKRIANRGMLRRAPPNPEKDLKKNAKRIIRFATRNLEVIKKH
jgi:hypothetical protein